MSIVGAHLLINMKEAGEKGRNPGTSFWKRSTISGMDFAGPPAAVAQSVSEHISEGVGESEQDVEETA